MEPRGMVHSTGCREKLLSVQHFLNFTILKSIALKAFLD